MLELAPIDTGAQNDLRRVRRVDIGTAEAELRDLNRVVETSLLYTPDVDDQRLGQAGQAHPDLLVILRENVLGFAAFDT